MNYTKEQIASYVLGWLSAGNETHDFNDVFAAIKNAALMVDDTQDGITYIIMNVMNIIFLWV